MKISLAGIPVFVYHGIAEGRPAGLSFRERKYWVGRQELASQLRAFRADGYKATGLDEFWAGGRATDPDRRAVITFDDGNQSDYDMAFPLLQEHGMRAAFFVNTATVGKKNYLDWRRIAEMQRAGMSIQSHAHDHVYLSLLNRERAKTQIVRSKAVLEDHLGCRVSFLAAPFGDFDKGVLELAKEAGYRALCTGRSLPAKISRGYIDRTVIYGSTSDEQFRAFLRRSPLAYSGRAIRACLKQVPKRMWIGLRQQEAGAA